MVFSYTNFIEIGQVGQLSPETPHYVLKFAELGRVTFPLSLDDGRSKSCRGFGRQKLINFHWSVIFFQPTHAIEVLLIKESIVIDVYG